MACKGEIGRKALDELQKELVDEREDLRKVTYWDQKPYLDGPQKEGEVNGDFSAHCTWASYWEGRQGSPLKTIGEGRVGWRLRMRELGVQRGTMASIFKGSLKC